MNGLSETPEHAAIPGVDPPITADEVTRGASFTPITDFKFPSRKQNHMAVATTRPNGGWVAYHMRIEGDDYKSLKKSVLNRGTKLHQVDAEDLFPQFKHLQYEW